VKIGCFGCLTMLVVSLSIAGMFWTGRRVLQEPRHHVTASNAEDGVRAQQKIFDLWRHEKRRGPRGAQSIVLSERELDALVSRHLAEIADLPLSDLSLRLPGDGIAEFRARLPLRQLVMEPPVESVGGMLPAWWLDRRVWLRIGTRPRLDVTDGPRHRQYLRFEVTEFVIGRQRLPATLLRVLIDPAALRVLHWPLPDGVEAVTVEAGRVVVQTGS
jgi:hypothetical protein